jgi:hypothetical protein
MPIRRIACPTGLALSILLLCAPSATARQVNLSDLPAPPRDRVPPPRTGTAGIKGQVVDGVTGAAVARARVTVQYYVVAVDDLEPDDYRDPAVLDRLRSSAMRVTIPDGSTVDVPLRRASFADIMATR